MPRNPKPGARLGKKERQLANALVTSDSVAGAGRKVGMSRQAAQDAFEALKIKAPLRCEQLGISRDRVLQRFDHWAENADREVQGKFGEKLKLEATDLRIKANENIAKIMGCYGADSEDGTEANRGSGQIVINLGFLDPARAEAILSLQSRGSTSDHSSRGISKESTDVAPGRREL